MDQEEERPLSQENDEIGRPDSRKMTLNLLLSTWTATRVSYSSASYFGSGVGAYVLIQ